MNLKTLITTAAALVSIGWSGGAAAATYSSYTSVLTGGTLIDFEGQANGTRIDTQYSGVTFGQLPGGRPQIDVYPSIFGYGPSSGNAVLTGTTEGGVTFDTIAGLTANFATGKNGVEFFFSDTAPIGNYPITFYGLGGAVLGSVNLLKGNILPPGYVGGTFPPPGTNPKPGIYIGYTSAVNEIYGIGIGPSSATNDSFAIDDLRFTSARGAVPEPAAWAMMLLGFGLVGSATRGAKRRQTLGVSYA
ncbi:MAG TPA: PEPxxWA-CTERM sorting domain-containing protein [Sphingomonas sp.]|jgi:hypothetical protein|nr:PEPxxWA-CTERM sorting domain-containing protein [Sphingomonas sp.]